MSTIERAMNKASGAPREAWQVPEGHPETMPPPTDTESEAQVREVERTQPAPQEFAPRQERQETPARFDPVETSERSTQRVDIDLEKLAAAGFLVPGTSPDRKSEEFQHIKRRLLGNAMDGMLPSHAATN